MGDKMVIWAAGDHKFLEEEQSERERLAHYVSVSGKEVRGEQGIEL